jgi:UDP-N-acetylglucosamine acyltransferase
MRRRRFTHKRLQIVREFYQKLFHSRGVFAERLASVQSMSEADPAIAEILTFIGDGTKRPLCMAHNKSDRLAQTADTET